MQEKWAGTRFGRPPIPRPLRRDVVNINDLIFDTMKGLYLQVMILLVAILAGVVQSSAQCSGPMGVTIQGAGTGLPLSVSETHTDARCPDDMGSVTISATGGTEPYTGVGVFTQAIGVQSYTVIDFVGCLSNITVAITFNPRPTGNINGTTTICQGITTQVTLTVNGTGLITGTLSDGTTFSGNAPTILVDVMPMTTTTYTIATLEDENCSSTFDDLSGSATVVVLQCTDISGKIIWEGNRLTLMSGVNGTTVNLTGDDTDTDVTGLLGTYSLFADMGSNFMVTPQKNRPMPQALNGLTAADASRIQMHVAGSLPLGDPYKIIAADVNKSNSVTSSDATIVQQAVLGNPSAQQYFINTTWRFVPKTYVFPSPTAPWGFPEKINLVGVSGAVLGQDFIGMKLGDVNSTANPVNKPGMAVPDLVWKVQDQALEQDATLLVEFRAENFNALLALQFGLFFDPSRLELMGIESIPGSPLQEGNFGRYNQSAGEIRALLSMTEISTMAEGAPAFRLRFRSLQTGGKLSEALLLTDEVLLGEAYTSEFISGPVSLKYESMVTSTQEPGSAYFRLMQNRPNPFKYITTIGFVLPDACEGQLRIFDVSGRQLGVQKGSFVRGYNEQEVHLEEYTGYGVLYYELVTPFGVLSKKMTRLN